MQSNAAQQKHISARTAQPHFAVIQRKVENPHHFQFYVKHGSTSAGPWVKVVLNDTAYIAGFVPAGTLTHNHCPSQGENHGIAEAQS